LPPASGPSSMSPTPDPFRAGKPQYRPDVDGLRAVAILAVLGFHAFPERVPGGFVGVDVFFVISGFLITGILLDGFAARSLTLATFYARRVRRIFPALVLVAFACGVAGWFLLLPDEYAQVGKHMAAGLAFVSNLALWREAGYFDSASETKPLLHLWSLGIEEQFYLLWPLLLIGARRLGLRRLIAPVVLLGLASFLLGIFLLAPSPAAAFYLPFARFWELMAGALLSCMQRERPLAPIAARSRFQSFLSHVLSLAGLSLVLVATFALDRDTPFPGWWALTPAAGAFLMVLARDSWFNRRVLASPLLVHIGLISFPLYLWHWPLLAMARVTLGQVPPPSIRLALVAAAFLAAELTYRFVERPFRTGSGSVRLLAAAALLVAAAGLAIRQSYGFGFRFDEIEAVKDLSYVQQWGRNAATQAPCLPPHEDWREPTCRLSIAGHPRVALFGDSHAQHLFPGLADQAPSRSLLLLTIPGCPPVSGISLAMTTGECRRRSEQALSALLAQPGIQTVMLAFQSAYLSDTAFTADYVAKGQRAATMSIPGVRFTSREDVFLFGLESTVRTLEAAGKEVAILLDTPELPFSPRDCLRRRLLGFGGLSTECVLRTDVVRERQRAYREVVLRLVARHPQIGVFDPIPVLCPDDTCRYQDSEGLLFRDSHHLSLRGSTLIARSLHQWAGRTRVETGKPGLDSSHP